MHGKIPPYPPRSPRTQPSSCTKPSNVLEQYGVRAGCSLRKLFKLNWMCEANQKCSPWALCSVTKYWRWFVCMWPAQALKRKLSLVWICVETSFYSSLVQTLAKAQRSPLNAASPVLLSNPPGPLWSLPEQSALPPCFKIVTYLPRPSPFWRPAGVFIFFDTMPGFNSLIPAVALEVSKHTQCPPRSPSSCLWFYN